MNTNKNVTIILVTLFVNKMPFFVTTNRNIKFTTIKLRSNRTLIKLVSSIETINSIYSKKIFDIKTTLIDREF